MGSLGKSVDGQTEIIKMETGSQIKMNHLVYQNFCHNIIDIELSSGKYVVIACMAGKIDPLQGNYNQLLHQMTGQYYGKEEPSISNRFLLPELKKRCLAEQEKNVTDLLYIPKEDIWLEIHSFYFMEEGQEHIQIVACNVTSRIKKEEEGKQLLRDALKLAENASRAKSDFLSQMSQDICIPVNSILTMLKTARDNMEKQEILNNCFDKIENSGQYLMNLLKNLIDMAEIENGNLILEKEPVNLSDLLEDVAQTMAPMAQEKLITFQVVDQADTYMKEHYFQGDVLRLKQILVQLLMNAIRFTPSGGKVELRVEEEKTAEDRSSLKMTVMDNGIGIKNRDMETLFKPFEQGSSVEGDSGSGLGLAICHSLVRMMNGKIKAESEEGSGSRFQVSIPVEIGGCLPDAEKEEEFFEEESGIRLLLADDNLFNAEMTVTILEINGYLVDVAAHGLEAVEKFRNSKPGYYKAILMDVQMPIRNGIMASKDIRRLDREDAGEIPIIALSRNQIPEDSPVRETIITDYLAKPVDSSALLQMLAQYCIKK